MSTKLFFICENCGNKGAFGNWNFRFTCYIINCDLMLSCFHVSNIRRMCYPLSRGKQCNKIMSWFFWASVSDRWNPRLCRLLLCILPSSSIFNNPFHSHHIGSSAHLSVPFLRPFISYCHTRSFDHLGVAHILSIIPIAHPDFLSLLVAVLLHAHLPTAPHPPFSFPWVLHGGPKLFFRRLLAPPHLPPPLPSFIPCLPCIYLK